jgi:hypothetical protein
LPVVVMALNKRKKSKVPKSIAFYGLAAILNFSAILNFKERQQDFFFLSSKLSFKILK